MSGIQQLVTFLASLASVILLLIVLRLFADLRLDAFRQDMFALRDEVFDFAMNGNIGFSHPSYRLLRKSMNGFIRYAHNLTFYRLMITMLQWRLLSREPEIKWAEEWDHALESIADNRVRETMKEFHDRSFELVAKRVVLGSPILVTVMVCTIIRHGLSSLTKAVAGSLSEFIDQRVLEEEAARAAA